MSKCTEDLEPQGPTKDYYLYNPLTEGEIKFPRSHKSFSNTEEFSDTTNSNRDSFGESRKLSKYDCDYPKFYRSNSVRINHTSIYTDGIKEEQNEDESRDSIDSFLSLKNRKLKKYYTIFPKEDLLLFDSKTKPQPEPFILKGGKIMDVVPEIEDDNSNKNTELFFLKSPRIKIQSDNKEDLKILNPSLQQLTKTPITENDIIKEEKEIENDNENAFELNEIKNKELIRAKFEHFIDKEEPPLKDLPVQTNVVLNYQDDVIKEDEEEEQKSDVKDFMQREKNKKRYKTVQADEINDVKPSRVHTILSKIGIEDEEPINESDEYPN